MSCCLRYSWAWRSSEMKRPNLERTPAESSHLPLPRAAGLDADADARADAVGLGVLDDEFEVAELLDDGDDVAAELGGEDDGLDELVVLEAVADDGHGRSRSGRPRSVVMPSTARARAWSRPRARS
jgi:hypothetical protein